MSTAERIDGWNEGFSDGLKVGAQDERERILELLEDMRGTRQVVGLLGLTALDAAIKKVRDTVEAVGPTREDQR
jgi:hypothetical protein